MKTLRTLDNATTAVLVAGSAAAIFASLQDKKDREEQNGMQLAALGLMGLAAAYKLIRPIAPKPKYEQRMQKLAGIYDQAEAYQRRAMMYRQAADLFVKDRLKHMKRK